MDRYPFILGCLQGTALGDAVGLRREGLSRQRAAKMYGEGLLSPNLLFGLGMCSDDTEHTQMVGRALALSGGDTTEFQRAFARQLRCWLMCVPAGIGFATLRACLRLMVRISPARSGVHSAGNGPAMRSALLGVWAESDQQLVELVRCCSRLTHTDFRAEEGARLVARAARVTVSGQNLTPIQFLEKQVAEIQGDDLRKRIDQAIVGFEQGMSPGQFAESQGWSKGISGYVNQTVPAALYCWAHSPHDFKACVRSAVLLGGDTDSVAAIAGAVCGANLGSDQLPAEWLDKLTEWPRGHQWMDRLAKSLSDPEIRRQPVEPPGMRWPATLIRNFLFAAIVLCLGFRRLLPPY